MSETESELPPIDDDEALEGLSPEERFHTKVHAAVELALATLPHHPTLVELLIDGDYDEFAVQIAQVYTQAGYSSYDIGVILRRPNGAEQLRQDAAERRRIDRLQHVWDQIVIVKDWFGDSISWPEYEPSQAADVD